MKAEIIKSEIDVTITLSGEEAEALLKSLGGLTRSYEEDNCGMTLEQSRMTSNIHRVLHSVLFPSPEHD